MPEEKITYFEKGGPANTEETLRLAVSEARRLGIKDIVISSSRGDTALALKDAEGLNVTIVTLAYGQKEPGQNPMSAEVRAQLIEKGYNVCTAAHTLSGVERSFSTTFGGAYPVEIMAHTLRMIGRGTKVCVEISAMAADAGYIVGSQPVVAVAGSGAGADTAIVLRPEASSRMLKTKVDRFICKPID